MKNLTFRRGGVHPDDKKSLSSSGKISVLPMPDRVYVSMSQHLGAPSTPVVAVGDSVKVGQVLGQPSGFMSAFIHSPASGVVRSIGPRADLAGNMVNHIEIEVIGDEWMEDIDRKPNLVTEIKLDKQEILERVKQCGIVGLGGATFPTHIKLCPPPGKKAEMLIINGAECEPYLTSDHRVMVERSSEIVMGAAIMSRALDGCPVTIAIEENKREAIIMMNSALSTLRAVDRSFDNISVVVLKRKYPQGSEKHIIDAVMDRQVPSGRLPIDVGAVVQNVSTALAVYEAVQKNKPLISNVMTVVGDCVFTGGNFLFRIGMPLSYIAKCAGGIPVAASKIVSGGPMMGKAVSNMEAGAVKGTSSLLYLDESRTRRRPHTACIRCGRCVDACPMGLWPFMLFRLAKLGDKDNLEKYSVQDCLECGCCQYGCPAGMPLLDLIRPAKADVLKIIKSRK